MRSVPVARAALLVGAAFLIVATLLPGSDRFPWLLQFSLACSVLGAALAWASRGPARLAALTLLVLGWYLRIHADPALDGLPPEPLISRWFDLSPVLGCALGAAGLLAVNRRLLGLGGVLLLMVGLYPQGTGGSVAIPLLKAIESPGWTLVLLVATTVLGAGLLWAARAPAPSPVILQRAAAACLLVVPVWLLARLAFHPALFAAGDLLVIAGGAALFAGEKADAQIMIAAEALAIAFISAFWWLLKIHGLGYAAMDEYIYFYAADAWTKGLWPYRDFFFSHPPIHIAIPAALFAITGGFHHLLAKLIAPVSLFIAGLVLWRSARRHFGPVAAIASLILFWFASEILVASTTFTGVELTTLFLVLGITTALDRRSFIAGLWFGVAACTGIYGVCGFLTFVVLALFAPRRPEGGKLPGSRRDAARMAAGFALVFAGVNLAFCALGGSRYLDGVYRYHLLKAVRNPEQYTLGDSYLAPLYNFEILLQGHDFRVGLSMHPVHYWLAVVALLLLAARRASAGQWMLPVPWRWWAAKPGGTNPDGAVMLLWLSFAGTLAELGSLNERFPYYFAIVFPTLALIGGFGIAEVVRLCDAALAPPETPPAPKKGKAPPAAPPVPHAASWIPAAVALVLVALWVPLGMWSNVTAFPEEIKPVGSSQGLGEIVHFDWTPSPVLPALGELAHALVWSDTRSRGDLVPTVRHFLWTKKRTFDMAPMIAAYVDAHTTPEDTIFGSSDFAPLIALLAHRRLAGNQVDTNSKVFTTGIVGEDTFWSSVCRDRPAYLVATAMSFFSPGTFSNRPRIADTFQHEVTFEDHGLKLGRTFNIELWRRQREPPDTICTP